MLSVTLALAFFSLLAAAAPSVEVEKRQGSVTALSSSTLAGFAPYTQFARAAYCDSSKVAKWSCGQACAALPGFQPTLTGGNGNDIQLFFVGYWPSQNTVVVGHQGTDPTQFESLLTDVNIPLRALSTSLFPGVSSSVQVHQGFADQHAKTASQILAEVKKLMSSKSTNKVTLIGHSLGGALAELDALFMKLQLPTAQIKAVTYGTPRVGNPAYAAYFNQQVPDFTRVNNRDDLIPIVPGRFLGFEHPAGQVHIIDDGNAVACAGDENEDDRCTDGAVENIFEGNIIDHLGPYEGIFIGTIFCN